MIGVVQCGGVCTLGFLFSFCFCLCAWMEVAPFPGGRRKEQSRVMGEMKRQGTKRVDAGEKEENQEQLHDFILQPWLSQQLQDKIWE